MKNFASSLAQPLLMSEEGKRVLVAGWADVAAEARRREGTPLPRANPTHGAPLIEGDDSAYVRDNVGVIQVYGPLFRRECWMTYLFGGSSYDRIRAQVAAAQAQRLKGVAFDFNTPGGEADGCSETADLIFKLRQVLPVESFAGGYATSAGAWLASATSKTTIADTAVLGSIGVRLALVDYAEMEKKYGVRVLDLVSSRAAGKRDLPLDDEVVAKYQVLIDALEEVFIAKMALQRGVSEAEVVASFGGGGCLVGKYAVKAGLADEIGSLEQVIARMARGSAQTTPALRATGGKDKPMKVQTAGAARAEDKPEETAAEGEKCSKCDGEGEKDGEECKACGGSGKTKAKAADDDDNKPEETAEDDETMAEEEKKENAAAHAKIVAKLGLKTGASLSAIAAALEAKTVSLSESEQKQAALEAQVGELAQKLEAREAAEKKKDAQSFAATAVKEGRTTEEKRPRVEEEHQAKGAKAAEALLFPKGTFSALKRFSDGKGGIIGKDEKPENSFAQDDPKAIEAALVAKAEEIAKRDKISAKDAMKKIAVEAPELYAAYKALFAI